MGNEIVELIVGPEKERFAVHKELLCAKIPYFENMFKGGFAEAANKSATFPEDSVQSFDLLLGWVYVGKLRTFAGTKDKSSLSVTGNWSLAKFYELAQKFCLPDLQDYAIDVYIGEARDLNHVPKVATMTKMYQQGAPGCGLRRFALANLRWVMSSAFNDENRTQKWPVAELHELLTRDSELALDFIISTRNGDAVTDPRKLPRCTFHQHGEDKPCYLVTEKEMTPRAWNDFRS